MAYRGLTGIVLICWIGYRQYIGASCPHCLGSVRGCGGKAALAVNVTCMGQPPGSLTTARTGGVPKNEKLG